MPKAKTTGKGWSWTRLVREYGEEGAFARLPYMTGLGEYSGFETVEDHQPTPYVPPQAGPPAEGWRRTMVGITGHVVPPWLLRVGVDPRAIDRAAQRRQAGFHEKEGHEGHR